MVKHSLMHPLAFHPYQRPLASSTGRPDAQEEEVVTNFSLVGTLSPARTRIRRRPRKADISNETDSEEEGSGHQLCDSWTTISTWSLLLLSNSNLHHREASGPSARQYGARSLCWASAKEPRKRWRRGGPSAQRASRKARDYQGYDELETLGKGDVPDLSWTDEVACCIALWPYILLFVPQYRIPKQDAYGIGNKPLRVSPPRCSICP
ncbi:hypothetical protein CCMSSC00406_0006686 [Pleurotus cornucopiae]|uniref:Uncharacterized protein n=1 Tax=Pleurotus cornucopiae TaxID=5321 RepID=A0ACB7IW44_PLECO|nr:hypothetical protein CCMSSC00406_0006686 [Pleurotus cornucopiae]